MKNTNNIIYIFIISLFHPLPARACVHAHARTRGGGVKVGSKFHFDSESSHANEPRTVWSLHRASEKAFFGNRCE